MTSFIKSRESGEKLPLDLPGHNPWRAESSEIVLERKGFRVIEDAVVQPDGSPGTYTFLRLPHPVVGVVPLDDQRRVYLVRQWRYPWQRNSWEIPAGHCEAGEEPSDAAARELAEEVGLQANEWTSLGYCRPSAIMDVDFHLFVARSLSPARPVPRDASESDMVARAISLDQALAAVDEGIIVHAVTALALLRAKRLLCRHDFEEPEH